MLLFCWQEGEWTSGDEVDVVDHDDDHDVDGGDGIHPEYQRRTYL